ncbi:ATP-binding protein [Streptomyces mutomycini]|uniref:ATP-binding protein n=1 Tax=Streptomyces mutomycini TaxID=284036 RepID=A0ABW0B6U8_9ACTN|nr:BTAD domain-containing putative transcriptional regulator [Streptomyces mutomycini]
MRYQILGPARAFREDGTPVTVGGARLRALLTALALRPGHSIPVPLLVDAVWVDAPPADAAGALHALVGRLRRALGPGTVTSADGGYALCAAPSDIDAHRFEQLARDGTRLLAAGDAAAALALLDEALALWPGGPALADLPEHSTEAGRLGTRLFETRRGRLGALTALGRAEEALPELMALCDEHPLDEPLQALRLRALRATGRTAEALDAYETLRRDLADRLGADPGDELRSLHGELLAPPGQEAASEEPAGPGGKLRARLTSFVGRQDDIASIGADLVRARLVTLLGPGGAGKTRLSMEAAEAADAGRRWPDGVWLAELAPVEDPSTVPEVVLTALGARQTVLPGAKTEELRAVDRGTGDAPLVRLTEHCGGRRMLLLLDNCEHVVDAAARLTEEVLARCPGVTVLATSREPLGVPGEVLRPVEPLPGPMALRLFTERGVAARPGFRPEDDPEAAAEICRRLDGLPLAIELAAARLRILTPRQIADRLDDRFLLLTGGARTVLPRQQTLRAVVDWSWDLLGAEERAVLCALSVFAGDCDLPAVEAVCGAGALGLLGSLVDKSLVVASAPTASGTGMRYRLLETIGEYAAERLDESGRRPGVERRHLVHFRELARRTNPLLRGDGQRAAIAVFENEYENLRAALRRAVAAADEHEALCLVHTLAWYWQIRDLRADARHWSGAVAALGPDPFAAPAVPAPPLHARCTDAPPPMPPDLLVEARRGVRLIHLASMSHELDRWTMPEAVEYCGRIVEVYWPGVPQTCRTPGVLWIHAVMLTGEPGRLLQLVDRAVEACRSLGDDWDLASALQLRANMLANRGDKTGEAARDADESLALFTRLGDSWGAAEALSVRGESYERVGDNAGAAKDFRAAIRHAQQLGALSQVAVLKTRLAGVLTEPGQDAEAEAVLREVLAEADRHSHMVEPAARMTLAVWLNRTGRTDEARAELERLLGTFRYSSLATFEGLVHGLLAWTANLDGRYADALDRAREALDRARDPLGALVAPQMPAVHLMTMARALAGLGGTVRVANAARLLGAADALLPPGYSPAAQERTSHEDAEAAVRTGLTDAAYELLYAEGGRLTVDEAASLSAL